MTFEMTKTQFELCQSVLDDAIARQQKHLKAAKDCNIKEAAEARLAELTELSEIMDYLHMDAIAAEDRTGKSVYDNIQSAKELVSHVMCHGLSTKQEDLVKAQDIFGHATEEELIALANDIGRNNENGEPDPDGTWSSIRRETRSAFYMILFNIWNWEDATRFWNNHTDPEHKELDRLRVRVANLEKDRGDSEKTINRLRDENTLLTEGHNRMADRMSLMEHRAVDLEAENIRLKAKLYDLLYGEGDDGNDSIQTGRYSASLEKYNERRGDQLIARNEQLKKDPDAAVPEDVRRRMLDTIDRAFARPMEDGDDGW